MNTSNRFNVETVARQRQAEIEKHIRQTAQLSNASSPRHFAYPNPRWKIGVASLSVLSLIALIIIGHLH